ncbi:MAG: AVAST type 2 anti-phage system protein Avs2 [Candidatus Ratteibacteria bacterium]|jgi:hypothetical protein
MKFLDKKWLEFHLKQIKGRAKNRYTPKLNIDLPISEVFDGISKTKSFYSSIRIHFGKMRCEFSRLSSKYENQEIQKLYGNYSRIITPLLKTLEKTKEYDKTVIPWKTIGIQAKKTNKLSWEFSDKLRKEKDKIEKQEMPDNQSNTRSLADRLDSDIHYLYEIKKELRYFEEFSNSVAANLSNTPFLLLTGIAGTGKTHLLCDVVENRLKDTSCLPSVLLFGEFFNGKTDLWEQIAIQLGLNDNYTKDKILNLLDKAGERNNARSLLIIDALNETRPLRFWKSNLKKLYNEVKNYHHIALVVSIRSGFEKEILTKNTRKLFIQEEHHGFQFREWEAVTKFFKEFSLPLPEIPLLMPEFQNPLFLLLFCKAFQNRSKGKDGKKQIFRGHEGATYIFENFVNGVSRRIAKQFGIDYGTGKNIWDKVIEKIAAKMVEQNNDRIPEEEIINIVKNAYPAIKYGSFLKELERNLLLIKVPRYSADYKQMAGFDYRFPFQKFSDHLIGRFIFKKYRLSHRTPKQFFAKNTHIGKFFGKGWNRGIIEALCIQCPEQLKGIEFFEVAPYVNSYVLVEAFTESLIWRRPNAFAKDLKKTLEYINKHVIVTELGHRNLLNAFLSVAPVPEHLFNAQFLHKHLAKIVMPKRDSWWSTFLNYQYGEKGSVDRLIEWGWSDQNKTHIKDDSIKLCSIALAWFLTASNRFIRDKATKALVGLLTDRLPVIVELLDQFNGVDDPYVTERLYAVAYGCSLRNSEDKQSIKKLAQWFYDNVFKSGQPFVSILIRDYARGVIEVAIQRKLIKIDRTKIKPPYGSKWPEKIPSEKILRKKYYPKNYLKNKTEDRGYFDIWSSVMHDSGSLGDFGNYVVNSALGYWSGIRLGSSQVSKNKQFEIFKANLTKRQLGLFNRAIPFLGAKLSNILLKYFDSKKAQNISEAKLKEQEKKDELRRKEDVKIFKESLSSQKRKFYEKEIEPYLNGRNKINDPLDGFDTGLAQRWIFNRVVQLGWSNKLHGQFDKDVGYYRADRSTHKAERIGKKYQWIAFYELLALIADNFQFKKDRWSDNSSNYDGPWQIGIRDIDPSCTLREDPKEIHENTPILNNCKSNYNAWRKKATHTTWLKTTSDLPDPKSVIEMVDKENVEWVILGGFFEWQEEIPPEQEKYSLPTRKLWYMLKSYFVKKNAAVKVYDWAKEQSFMGRWMPESHEFYGVFLGEYPSSPAFLDYSIHDGWISGERYKKIPAKVLITDDQYLSSGSSIDCSTNETVSVKLPAKWIVNQMKLVQKNTDGRFFDKEGCLVAFDPTIFVKDLPRCLFFRKDKLCQFLKKGGYDILWIFLGEKGMIGGGVSGQPLGWLEINGAYKLDQNNEVIGQMKSVFKKSGGK